MKKYYLMMLMSAALWISSPIFAQDKSARPSPPAQAEATIDGADVTIDYSRPSAKGRKIFGGLVPYGKVWRTGANESTWIDVSEDVKINGQKLAKGRYAIFTIPNEDEWAVMFNRKWQDWGAYKYDPSQNALTIEVKPDNDAGMTETFTISVAESGRVVMAWENTAVAFNISM